MVPPATTLQIGAAHRATIRNNIRLEPAIARRQFPRCHPTAGKFCYLVLKVDSADADNVHLVGRVIESAVQRTVVALIRIKCRAAKLEPPIGAALF